MLVLGLRSVGKPDPELFLMQKLEDGEKNRITKFQKQSSVPAHYRRSMDKAEERRERAKEIQRMKMRKILKAEEVLA